MDSPSTDEFTMGICLMPAMTAREMNGIYVSFTPLRCSKLFFCFSRIFTMRVMSTLKTVWTCALVCFDSAMRLAMMLRILLIGTRSPESAYCPEGGGGDGDAVADACA